MKIFLVDIMRSKSNDKKIKLIKTNITNTSNDISFSIIFILKKVLNLIFKFKYLYLKKSPVFAGKNKLYV